MSTGGSLKLSEGSQTWVTEHIDRYAWEAICQWPHRSEAEVIRDGLDFSELSRRYLWGKVGRAIRKQQDGINFEFEAQHWPNKSCSIADEQQMAPFLFKESLQHLTKATYSRVKNGYRLGQLRLARLCNSQKVLYLPVISPRLKQTTLALLDSQPMIIVSRQHSQLGNHPRIYSAPTHLDPFRLDHGDLSYINQLHQGMLQGLQAHGIELLDGDVSLLKRELQELVSLVKAVRFELSLIQPDAILVHADNHPPHQAYVLVARQQRIPSIMLQHGLDCEHYYLDEAYASAIAVWGEARLHRYQKSSSHQPQLLEITGNPEYTQLRLPEKLNREGNYWLWATRPHTSDKCYAPSRSPKEGMAIFEALLAALKDTQQTKLVIKPHPYDYSDLYKEQIAKHPLKERVEISMAPLQTLFPDAQVVITEDSTAGLEAMFFGKLVIVAHFSATKPVTPFIEYNAALLALSSDMLKSCLQQLEQLTTEELDEVLVAQRRFLKYQVGPCDGLESNRIVSFISRVLNTQQNL